MSNTNTPFGFRKLGVAMGAVSPTGALIPARIAYNYNTAIYYGDPVSEDGAGNIIRSANGGGRPIVGIFQGCKYNDPSTGRVVWASGFPGTTLASTDYATAYISPISGAPSGLFAVQSYSTACTRAYIGLNVDLIYTAGTMTGGNSKSACTVDVANAATTYTLPFRIRGLLSETAAAGTPGTDDTSLYNIVIVSSNVGYDLGI